MTFIIKKSSDICTFICRQLSWQPVFLYSYWSKTMEREKGRERKRTSCETFVVIFGIIIKR